ncbi:ABC transporter permease [Kutzneria buriramensis]|uniref:Simple sugar transport system permease protein n=1 Tax=Kutzneria buriramensis TaxID=1045776 RepID=A0A3E0HDT3_9PSEU|nr:ABC transporter permease [Kutzneria buriramensis]REH42899.1 simple sugar transport system permease protein [Kutzneria buriramensis]
MVTEFLVFALVGTLNAATPLVLAGLGEVVLERSGAGFNLGIEGTMLAGALAGVLGSAAAGPWAGLAAGTTAGLCFGALHAAGLLAGVDTVLVGIVLTVLGTGLTTYLSQVLNPPGQPALGAPTLPVLGGSVGAGSVLAVGLTATTWWMLRGTRFGLRLRACGDDADIATTRGIPVRRQRVVAALVAGAFAGLAGAVLALASIGTFVPLMTGGRGFIALAVVIVARRTALGVVGGALFFAVFDALALLAQTYDLGLPVEAYQALPYLVTLILLCLEGQRRVRPKETP